MDIMEPVFKEALTRGIAYLVPHWSNRKPVQGVARLGTA